MHRPKINKTCQVHTSVTEAERDKLNDTSKRLNLSRAEVIRLCILNELPRLLDRESKRTKRQTQARGK